MWVSKEVWIWLTFRSWSWSSSWTSVCQRQLSLPTSSRCCGSRLSELMLVFDRVWCHLFLLLSRITSSSLILLLLLLMLLLKHDLLLFQNLDLISVLYRCWSLSIWRLVCWHKDFFRNFLSVFFIIPNLVLEVKLVTVRWISLRG